MGGGGNGTAVLTVDAANLEQVLTSIIHGAVELTDPVGQKTCFAILRKLIEVWGACCVPSLHLCSS